MTEDTYRGENNQEERRVFFKNNLARVWEVREGRGQRIWASVWQLLHENFKSLRISITWPFCSKESFLASRRRAGRDQQDCRWRGCIEQASIYLSVYRWCEKELVMILICVSKAWIYQCIDNGSNVCTHYTQPNSKDCIFLWFNCLHYIYT